MNLKPDTLEAFVQTVRDFGYPNFHLSICGGCNAPMWQQPCAMCGYYPMGGHGTEAEGCEVVEKEKWCRRVRSRGGVLKWFQDSHSGPSYDARREAALALGSDRLVEPEPEILFDTVTERALDAYRERYAERRQMAIFFGFAGNFAQEARKYLPAHKASRIDEARAWLHAACELHMKAVRNRTRRYEDPELVHAREVAQRNPTFGPTNFKTEEQWIAATQAL